MVSAGQKRKVIKVIVHGCGKLFLRVSWSNGNLKNELSYPPLTIGLKRVKLTELTDNRRTKSLWGLSDPDKHSVKGRGRDLRDIYIVRIQRVYAMSPVVNEITRYHSGYPGVAFQTHAGWRFSEEID